MEREISNWEIDIWYAIIILVVCGVVSHILGEYLVTNFSYGYLSDIAMSIAIILVSLPISFIFKNVIFGEVKDAVDESPADYLLSVAVVIILYVLINNMFEELTIFSLIGGLVGMTISFIADWIKDT